jgi:hypothetical protein
MFFLMESVKICPQFLAVAIGQAAIVLGAHQPVGRGAQYMGLPPRPKPPGLVRWRTHSRAMHGCMMVAPAAA